MPSASEDLVRDINRHAEVVLGGRARLLASTLGAGEDRGFDPPAASRRVDPRPSGLEDLAMMGAAEKPLEPLNIADASRYFDRQQQQHAQPSGLPASGRVSASVLERIASVDPYHLNPERAMDPGRAYAAMLDCTHGRGGGDGAEAKGDSCLQDEALMANVRAVVRAPRQHQRLLFSRGDCWCLTHTGPARSRHRQRALSPVLGLPTRGLAGKGERLPAFYPCSLLPVCRPTRPSSESILSAELEGQAARRGRCTVEARGGHAPAAAPGQGSVPTAAAAPERHARGCDGTTLNTCCFREVLISKTLIGKFNNGNNVPRA